MGGRASSRQGEANELASHLWRLECRRLLGRLSHEEYRQTLATLLPMPAERHGKLAAHSIGSARLAASRHIPADEDEHARPHRQPHTA